MTDGEGLLFQACDLRKTFGKEEVLNIEHLKVRRGMRSTFSATSTGGRAPSAPALQTRVPSARPLTQRPRSSTKLGWRFAIASSSKEELKPWPCR